MISEDESRLIQRAQRGDKAACAELYDSHYDAVYRYCYYRLGDAELAQDLTAEVFVRMVEKLERFKLKGRPLLAWLYTIARNLTIDVYRKQEKVTHLSIDEASALATGHEADLARAVDRGLRADCLAAALDHLTEDQRLVILLKFMEGRNNGQVARILSKSEGAVKSLQHRALSALRRAILRENCYEA